MVFVMEMGVIGEDSFGEVSGMVFERGVKKKELKGYGVLPFFGFHFEGSTWKQNLSIEEKDFNFDFVENFI